MLVTMSDKELSRINVIQSVVEKRMRRRDAAQLLALTERQTQRLMNRFRESGAAGLANLRRGRPGNHRLPESLKLRILSLLHDHYSDFGPTLAAEKLRERHNITVSVETLRKWMTADGLWVPYSRRRPRVHQPRYRRDCLGELVQIDGSPHDWFEGRAPKCCLLVFIDDATGRLMHLRFGEIESAFDYMMATREYLEQHGKPLAFYSDNVAEKPDLRDVFLCHAWDDRQGVAKELHDLLEAAGVKVWFSEKDLALGVPMMRAIDKGLANSRIGLVLVTPALLNRLPKEGVADKELSALLAGNQLVPIVHNTTYEALRNVSPLLASRSGLDTGEDTLEVVATKIAELITV